MFRMSKQDFDVLCNMIINAVGVEEFKPEWFIKERLSQHSMFKAHMQTTGGYMNGETKLAMTIRLMAGGSYMDIAALYCCGYLHTNEIFHATLKEWICNEKVLKFEGLEYLDNDESMLSNTRDFANTGCHEGILKGVIGSLDGWLVKIRCPMKRDNIEDTSSFYCRKGFHSINVQAIVSQKKKVLWRSIRCRGAEHDSNAFKKTDLYKKLLSIGQRLYDKGLYIVGDSAYSIRSFILVPYENATPQSPEDGFNYHHSCCRIWVECTFGEIDMRWGILWKPLHYPENSTQVVFSLACAK